MVWIVKLPLRSVTNIQVKIGGMFECLELSKKLRAISLLTLCTSVEDDVAGRSFPPHLLGGLTFQHLALRCPA